MKNYRNFLYVLLIIYTYSSEDNPISTSQIKDLLFTKYSIEIDYRTIEAIVTAFNSYQDDYEIMILKSNRMRYYFNITPTLEFGEAKAIVDLVYSSKFFSKTVKDNFIKRMKAELLNLDRDKLNKQLDTHISGNENDISFFHAFYTISSAIFSKNKLSFTYNKPLPNGVYSKNYDSTLPIETYCTNNTFYVYCFDETEQKLKSFRIDFMKDVTLFEPFEEDLSLKKEVKQKIIDSTYGYSSSRTTNLELTFKKDLYSNLIDKFGKDLPNCIQINEDYYKISLDCPISHTFYSWIIGFGGEIQITAPKTEVDAFKEFLLNQFINKNSD